jgi:hypothetical protein
MMSNSRRALLGLLAGFVLIAAAPSRADLILSGAITQISAPPSDVQGSDPTSNTTVFIWSERVGLTLLSPVSVQMTVPGTSDSSNSYQPSPGTIAMGTKVDTYLIHSDPVGSGAQNYAASVTFSTAILGIIDVTSGLAATDSQLGSLTTTYPGNSTDRGLESPDSLVWVSNNGLTLNFMTSSFVDEVRVVVASAPEPSTVVLALAGLPVVGIGVWLRRRKAQV